MLTQTVTITQNSTPNIIIGRRSTYETQQVIFDVSWLVQTYGEGTAELLIKRPKDASAYPVVATLDGNTLTWTVSDTDTQDKGHGECEIYWYVNGGLAKSCICGITILRDIGDTTETAPDPYETWVDELARLGAETLANAQAAEQSANNAAQSANEADNSAAAALESEENALDSENAAKASEQAAAASEQDAEQSATAARQSATEAAQSATNAHDDATDASASADRAEQAAASIEGDTERAEAAAQTAQGAASDASRFAGTASTKATEAAGSAATAEQAASTATQEAADASASATAAAGSASSASASATAAGNAQTAAETAQGKAEDAQEAAETAAQSIEDSAAQIDENTADILNLKSALNTKAGIIRDTASGSVASFVQDSTVPNLLGLSVALEPIQDLHGYDSPWPAGGGVNMFNPETVAVGYINDITGELNSLEPNSRASDYIDVLPDTSYYIANSAPSGRWGAWYDENKTYISPCNGIGVKTSPSNAMYMRITVSYSNNNIDFANNIIIAKSSSAVPFSPYSNLCPISGRESVEVEATGINIWDEEWELGYYTSTGEKKPSSGNICSSNPIPVIGGETYYCKSPYPNGLRIMALDVDGQVARDLGYIINAVFAIPDTAVSIVFYTNGADVITDYSGGVSVNYPSTDHDYHPYAGNRYTIQLGETVYGGTLTIAEDGSVNALIDRAMAEQTWGEMNLTYVGESFTNKNMPFGVDVLSGASNSICNCTATYIESTTYQSVHYYISSNRAMVLVTLPNDTASDTVVQVCAKLTNPITIQIDPVQIATIAGQTNNVWADAGDVTVEYAADLKHYIDSKIAAAVAALS